MSNEKPSITTLNTYTELNLRDLGIPSYVSKVMYALEKGFEKYTQDSFIIDELANAIWIKTLEGRLERGVLGRLDFAVLIKEWSSFQYLISYLTTQNELTRSRIFWNDRNAPFTLYYLPEPFIINLMPFEQHSENFRDGLIDTYENGLSIIELDERYRLKYSSFEGTIIHHILSWNFRENILSSMKSVEQTIQLIYSLFDCDWESNPALFEHYNIKMNEIVEENKNDIHWGFHWDIYGIRIVGESIREILNRNISVKNKCISCIDQSLEFYENFFDNRTGIEFSIGSTSVVSMNGPEIGRILHRLKRNIEE